MPENQSSSEPLTTPRSSERTPTRFPSDRFEVPSDEEIMTCVRRNKDHLDHRFRDVTQQ